MRLKSHHSAFCSPLYMLWLLTCPCLGESPTGAASTPSPAAKSKPPAEVPHSLDMAAATGLALDRQPSLATARAAIEKTRGELTAAGLLPNPTFVVEGEEVPQNWDLGAGLVMFKLNQTLLTGGKRRFRVRAATRRVERALTLYEQQGLEVLRDVKRSFIRLLGAERKRAIAMELSALASKFHQLVQVRVSEGVARPVEADRSLVLAAQAQFDVERAEAERAISRKELATSMGIPSEELHEIKGSLESSGVVPSIEALAREARESAPSLRIPQLDEEIAQQELSLGRAQRIPDIDIGVGPQHQRNPEGSHDLRGLQLSVPLPVFDHGQASRQMALADIEGAKSQQVKAWQDLENRLVQAHQTASRARQQIEAYEQKIVPAARRALSRTSEGYEAGEFTYLEVLDAQRSLTGANQSLVEALVELHSARADLELFVAGPIDHLDSAEGTKPETPQPSTPKKSPRGRKGTKR